MALSGMLEPVSSIQGMIVYPKHRHGSVRDAGASIQHPGMIVYPKHRQALSGMLEPVPSIQGMIVHPKHRHGSVRDAGSSIQHPGMIVSPKHRHGSVRNAESSIQHLGMIVYPKHRHGSVRDAGASIQHPGMIVYPKHRHGSVRNAGASIQHPGMIVNPKHRHDPVMEYWRQYPAPCIICRLIQSLTMSEMLKPWICQCLYSCNDHVRIPRAYCTYLWCMQGPGSTRSLHPVSPGSTQHSSQGLFTLLSITYIKDVNIFFPISEKGFNY